MMDGLTLDEVKERICAALVEPEDDWLAHAVRTIEGRINQTQKRRQYNTTSMGNRIRSARAILGMSQPQLAKRMGVNQYDVSAWELDKRAPPIWKIQPLCMCLQVDQEWLLKGDGGKAPKVEPGVLRKRLTPSAERQVKAVQLMTEARKKATALNQANRARKAAKES